MGGLELGAPWGGGGRQAHREGRGERKTSRHSQAEFLPFTKDPRAQPPHTTGVSSQGSLSYEEGPESCIRAAPPHPSSSQKPMCSSIHSFFKHKLSQSRQSPYFTGLSGDQPPPTCGCSALSQEDGP